MTSLVTQAAWVLAASFVLSLAYELYRATARAGSSRNDSIDAFVMRSSRRRTSAGVVPGGGRAAN